MKFFENLFKSILSELIAAGIIAFAGAIIAFFVARTANFTYLEIILLVILAFLILTVLSFLMIRYWNKKLPKYSTIDCDFHIIREERVHKWLNETDYVHVRRYTLKALKHGLEEYVDRFNWTGTEYILSGGNEIYSVEELPKTKNVFNQYRFKFSRPLNKGETIEVEAKWKMKGPAKPFFSATIQESTDLLIMSVMIYPTSNIKNVNCEIDPYQASRKPQQIKTVQLNSDGEYIWQVPNPQVLYHYEINW